ncbi:MAG: HDOD domain-containing protein [Gammaproteobacteria bacterium]|nr:HDOD domain-containing protein [Gammaproteobacteria bacterium]
MSIASLIDKAELKLSVELINKHKVPTPSDTLMTLERELSSAKPNSKLILELINEDIGLASAVIKVINSSQYNLSQEVTSIEHAVNLLGIKQLKNAIIQPAYKNALANQIKGFEEISEHSHYVGMLAMIVADYVSFDESIDINMFYLAGLFHDVGVLIMDAEFPDYMEFYLENESHPLSILVKEKANYNLRHTAIAVLMAKKWGLPDDVCNAIYLHHDTYGVYKNKVGYKTLTIAEILKLAHSLNYMYLHKGAESSHTENELMYINSINELLLDETQIDNIKTDISSFLI